MEISTGLSASFALFGIWDDASLIAVATSGGKSSSVCSWHAVVLDDSKCVSGWLRLGLRFCRFDLPILCLLSVLQRSQRANLRGDWLYTLGSFSQKTTQHAERGVSELLQCLHSGSYGGVFVLG